MTHFTASLSLSLSLSLSGSGSQHCSCELRQPQQVVFHLRHHQLSLCTCVHWLSGPVGGAHRCAGLHPPAGAPQPAHRGGGGGGTFGCKWWSTFWLSVFLRTWKIYSFCYDISLTVVCTDVQMRCVFSVRCDWCRQVGKKKPTRHTKNFEVIVTFVCMMLNLRSS